MSASPGPSEATAPVGAAADPIATAAPSQRSFAAVIAALMCVHGSMSATRVTASLWLLRENYPEWTVGVLLSLFAVVPIGVSLWAGRLADRHGLHRPLAIGAALGFSGPLVVLIQFNAASIVYAALVTGGAVSLAAVAIQHQAGRMARDDHDLKRVFGWVALGPALSNSLAPVVVGLLIDHAGYHAAFGFALALPALAWALGRWVPRQPAAESGAAPGVPERAALELLRSAPLRHLLLVNLSLSSCWDAHSFAVPVLGHARHLSASAIGTVLGSFSVAATGVRVFISRFARRLDERRALVAAMVLAAATSACYVFLPGLGGMMAGSFVLGLALGSVQPMVLSMLHQVTPPERRGQALGLRMLFTNAASIPMPTGFGALAALTFPAAPMWLMASLVALAILPARRIAFGRRPG